MDENGPILSEISLIVQKLSEHEVAYIIGGGKFIRKYHERLKGWLGENDMEEIFVRLMQANADAVAKAVGLRPAFSLIEADYGTISSAFHPGMSSDGVAAKVAEKLIPDWLVIITNVKGIWDENKQHIDRMTFEELAAVDVDESACSYWVLDGTARKVISGNKIPTVVGRWEGSLEKLFREGTIIND